MPPLDEPYPPLEGKHPLLALKPSSFGDKFPAAYIASANLLFTSFPSSFPTELSVQSGRYADGSLG